MGRTIDQISDLIQRIQKEPDSRRLIVSAWNVGEINKMALPPCHALFQFYVAGGNLSCQLYQRSADIFLGVPFNIASYALLTMMVAQVCNLGLENLCILLVMRISIAIIWSKHAFSLPGCPTPCHRMRINPDVKSIFDFDYDDFELLNYQAHPNIRAIFPYENLSARGNG